MYEIYTKYDDGFEHRKSFEKIEEAKSYFHNVDVQDIEICTLCETNADGSTEIARKEPRKKPSAPPSNDA